MVLACGAWRDRPLPIEGADAYVGRGLIYQNPFIIWFNHADEPGYTGPVFEPRDGALVVGGGLASIDVVKALMLMTVREKLRARGIEQDLVEMEVKGIPKILEHHGLAWAAHLTQRQRQYCLGRLYDHFLPVDHHAVDE